jgi:hypothetical protein
MRAALKPFEKATQVLSGREYATVSLITLVIGELWQTCCEVYEDHSSLGADPEGLGGLLVVQLRKSLEEVRLAAGVICLAAMCMCPTVTAVCITLWQHYGPILTGDNAAIAIATVLDPRTKAMQYLASEAKVKFLNHLHAAGSTVGKELQAKLR